MNSEHLATVACYCSIGGADRKCGNPVPYRVSTTCWHIRNNSGELVTKDPWSFYRDYTISHIEIGPTESRCAYRNLNISLPPLRSRDISNSDTIKLTH
jgi:hypothetical protein